MKNLQNKCKEGAAPILVYGGNQVLCYPKR